MIRCFKVLCLFLTSLKGASKRKPPTLTPQERWEEVAARHVQRESVRALARVYGVSHETMRMRQILKKTALGNRNSTMGMTLKDCISPEPR